jgi:hypothetical protein
MINRITPSREQILVYSGNGGGDGTRIFLRAGFIYHGLREGEKGCAAASTIVLEKVKKVMQHSDSHSDFSSETKLRSPKDISD